MLTNAAQARLSSAISTVGLVTTALSSTIDAVRTIDAVSKQVPGGTFLKRRAVSAVTSRLAWGVVPVIAVGAAYWGFRAWQRRKAGQERPSELTTVPLTDPAAPNDIADESSWESFPASDPPAASPGSSTPKVVWPR
jgi:hypothetical protein